MPDSLLAGMECLHASSLILREAAAQIDMVISFLDLPDELILQVAEELFSDDQCNLRLVSKKLDRLISPMLFETLRISEGYQWSSGSYKSLSEYISLGKELAFSHCTKKINIDASGVYPLKRHILWLRLLDSLVPTFVNLYSLKWSYWPGKHPVSPLVLDAFNSFGSIPSLRELVIRVVIFTPFPGFTLKSFSNLCSVSINWEHGADIDQDFINDIADLLGRCPNLEQFTFSIPRPYHPSKVPLFAHLFAGLPSTTCLQLRQLDLTGLHVSADAFHVHLRHFNSLKILQLMFNRHGDSPGQNDEICRLLLDNSIFLDELAIDTTHPTGVLDYLSSYSGLEHLTFRSRYPGADTPEGVHRFFSSVLPLHSATLRELLLGWSVETLWTSDITPEHLAQVEKCQQLTDLCCSVTLTARSTERTDRLVGLWLETAMKLSRLEYFTFYPTFHRQPPLQQGHFYYNLETTHDYEMTAEIDAFALKRVEKLTAGRVVPFRVFVSSPTLGP